MYFSAVNQSGDPLWRLTIEKQKTQTRRIINEGDYTWICGETSEGKLHYSQICLKTGRSRYEVGKTYPVQVKRGTSTIQVARMNTVEGIDYHYPSVIEKDDCDLFWAVCRPARIKILELWREDVRLISEANARAEGFDTPLDFLSCWVGMRDKTCCFYHATTDNPLKRWLMRDGLHTYIPSGDSIVTYRLQSRPLDLYLAWAIRYEMVEG